MWGHAGVRRKDDEGDAVAVADIYKQIGAILEGSSEVLGRCGTQWSIGDMPEAPVELWI